MRMQGCVEVPVLKGGQEVLVVPTVQGQLRNRKLERKALLEADPYAYKVRVHWIRCRGCDKDISLDKRSEYYPGLWIKHRRKCKEITKLREKVNEPVKVRKPRVGCGFDLIDLLSYFVWGTNSTTRIPVSATSPRRWGSI